MQSLVCLNLQKLDLIGLSGEFSAKPAHLSTSVDELLWISVDKLQNNDLEENLVDERWINTPTYPQVIHILKNWLKAYNRWAQKIMLDRLSTYPQSLLLLLIIKINII